MKGNKKYLLLLGVAIVITLPPFLSKKKEVKEETIQVAVAGNFMEPMKAIAPIFTSKTGIKVVLLFGSTGKLYAQIKNGAPFSLFLAADIKRPKLLEEDGLAKEGSRFTYAVGRIVLWSPSNDFVDNKGEILKSDKFTYLALPNPELAPYGEAAKVVLEKFSLWDSLQGKIVLGENLGQTFQFVKSGNAELAFISYSQLKRPGEDIKGSYWEIPDNLYSPIEQQAVILKDSHAAREFIKFLRSYEVKKIMEDYGYGVP